MPLVLLMKSDSLTVDKKKENLKVLYLARWYPHRYDPMPGLFIQRHAEAVNRFCDVGVVYTHILDGEHIDGFDVEFSVVNDVPTAKVYYSNSKFNFPALSQIIKAYRFFKANALGIHKISRELSGFDMVHVHVLTRLGLIALWYKWLKGKPYVISEHWSRYLSLTGDFKGFFRKWITRMVVKNASIVTTVTQNLANAMQSHGLKNPDYKVLANVVTDDFLKYEAESNRLNEKITFIHVSCFEDKSKNISGLLNVIKQLAEVRNDFVFRLVGEGMDFNSLKEYAGKLNLGKETVIFTGLLEGKSLVKEMSSADLMVVFSNYENFPVVINESFVLGVPVIATGVGGIPEFLNDTNGRLIKASDQQALFNLLNDFLNKKLSFDNKVIRETYRDAYSPETIGKELFRMYNSVLKK